MAEVFLEVKNLTKTIKGKPIVNGISFNLEEGKVVGFIGPNGAGKTTTMRMIMHLIKADSGSVSICGYDINKDTKKATSLIGGIIESPCFYKDYTGRQNLEMFRSLCCDKPSMQVDEKTGEEIDTYIEEIIDFLDMRSYIDDKAKTYSLGMKQRLGIGMSLMNDPKVLILDEPLNGLDPIGINELHKIIPKLAKKGKAILVSSHILKEVESICDECIMLLDGRSVDIKSKEGETLEQAFFRVLKEQEETNV